MVGDNVPSAHIIILLSSQEGVERVGVEMERGDGEGSGVSFDAIPQHPQQ